VRRLKTLGALLSTALCLGVVNVSTASGAAFVANHDPFFADYSGTTSEMTITYGEYGQYLNWCLKDGSFSGSFERASETLNPSTTIANGCEYPLNLNGCEFIYSITDEEPSGSGKFSGTVELGPPGCGPATVGSQPTKLYPTSGIHAEYWNVGSGNNTTVAGVVSGAVKASGPSGTVYNAKIKMNVSINATRLGSAVPFSVQRELPVPLGLENSNGSLLFAAESYPVNVRMATGWSAKPLWKVSGGLTAECSSSNYTTAISAATQTLTVEPSYSGCKLAAIPAVVRMNGCKYALTWTGENVGTTAISCPVGKVIEIVSYVNQASEEKEGKFTCKATIGPQTGTLGLTDQWYIGFWGLKSSISNLKYTWTRGSVYCPNTGPSPITAEDGSFSHQFKLAGGR
jgi:hypothetical protein